MRRLAVSTLLCSALVLSPMAWSQNFIASPHTRSLKSTNNTMSLAYPAGTTQTQTLRISWSGERAQLPHLQVSQLPTGASVRLLGWTPHKQALRLAVSIPAALAPGLYTAQISLQPPSGPLQPITLRLAVQALYIGLSGNGGHQGIVVESINGKMLTALSQRLTTGLPGQGRYGVSGMAYNPLNQTLFIYAGGPKYQTNIATLDGQFLSSPIPRQVIASAVPNFIEWDGGQNFLWSREGSWILTAQGGTVGRIYQKLPRDGDSTYPPSGFGILPGAGTADSQTGTIYLSNGAARIHHDPWVYEFNPQGRYLGAFHSAQIGHIMSLTYNPWNQEIYVMGHPHDNAAVSIHPFSAAGQPIPLPAGAFPGGRLLATPIAETVMSANPLNGHLYYLNRQAIEVYSPNGRLLRTLPSPAGANNITFVPGDVTPPASISTPMGASIYPSNRTAPQSIATSVITPPTACPSGYHCEPKQTATTPPPAAPSLNRTVHRVDNTVNNVSNLTNSIEDLAQALH